MLINIADILVELNHKLHPRIRERFKKFIEKDEHRHGRIWRIENYRVKKSDPSRRTISIEARVLSLKKRFAQAGALRKDLSRKQEVLRSFRFPLSLHKRLSFYLNTPVAVDAKKRKITCFYLEKNYRKIFDFKFIVYAYSQALASDSGLLLHAACVDIDNKAYLFLGASGGGKSTVAGLSRQHRIMGDDIIAVRKISGSYFAFATPWYQGRSINPVRNRPVEIKAMFFIKKAKEVSFRAIPRETALVRLLKQQIHFFMNTEMPLVKNIFFTAGDFVRSVPIFEMRFAKESSFWPELTQAISEGSKDD